MSEYLPLTINSSYQNRPLYDQVQPYQHDQVQPYQQQAQPVVGFGIVNTAQGGIAVAGQLGPDVVKKLVSLAVNTALFASGYFFCYFTRGSLHVKIKLTQKYKRGCFNLTY